MYPELVAFYQKESIPFEIEPEEIPFGVISLKSSADSKSLRELGEQLQVWKSQQNGICNILGLKRLLEGEMPVVATWLLGIPFFAGKPSYSGYFQCVECVALVTIDSSAEQIKLARSLSHLVADFRIGRAMSWDEYSFMNR